MTIIASLLFLNLCIMSLTALVIRIRKDEKLFESATNAEIRQIYIAARYDHLYTFRLVLRQLINKRLPFQTFYNQACGRMSQTTIDRLKSALLQTKYANEHFLHLDCLGRSPVLAETFIPLMKTKQIPPSVLNWNAPIERFSSEQIETIFETLPFDQWLSASWCHYYPFSPAESHKLAQANLPNIWIFLPPICCKSQPRLLNFYFHTAIQERHLMAMMLRAFRMTSQQELMRERDGKARFRFPNFAYGHLLNRLQLTTFSTDVAPQDRAIYNCLAASVYLSDLHLCGNAALQTIIIDDIHEGPSRYDQLTKHEVLAFAATYGHHQNLKWLVKIIANFVEDNRDGLIPALLEETLGLLHKSISNFADLRKQHGLLARLEEIIGVMVEQDDAVLESILNSAFDLTMLVPIQRRVDYFRKNSFTISGSGFRRPNCVFTQFVYSPSRRYYTLSSMCTFRGFCVEIFLVGGDRMWIPQPQHVNEDLGYLVSSLLLHSFMHQICLPDWIVGSMQFYKALIDSFAVDSLTLMGPYYSYTDLTDQGFRERLTDFASILDGAVNVLAESGLFTVEETISLLFNLF